MFDAHTMQVRRSNRHYRYISKAVVALLCVMGQFFPLVQADARPSSTSKIAFDFESRDTHIGAKIAQLFATRKLATLVGRKTFSSSGPCSISDPTTKCVVAPPPGGWNCTTDIGDTFPDADSFSYFVQNESAILSSTWNFLATEGLVPQPGDHNYSQIVFLNDATTNSTQLIQRGAIRGTCVDNMDFKPITLGRNLRNLTAGEIPQYISENAVLYITASFVVLVSYFSIMKGLYGQQIGFNHPGQYAAYCVSNYLGLLAVAEALHPDSSNKWLYGLSGCFIGIFGSGVFTKWTTAKLFQLPAAAQEVGRKISTVIALPEAAKESIMSFLGYLNGLLSNGGSDDAPQECENPGAAMGCAGVP